MSNSHSFSVQWSDIYQMLRTKAEGSRGTLARAHDGTPSSTFPRTTARDAFAIVLVFDQAVNDHAPGQFVARWIEETDLLAKEPDDSESIYVGNRSLWGTLAAAAIELDRVHAALPARSLIDEAMRQLAIPVAAEHPPGDAEDTMLVTVLTENSWRAMVIRQLEFFRVLRGETAGENPLLPRIPATCNADVLALADYWADQHARVGHSANDTYHRVIYSYWRVEMERAMRHARRAPALDIYVWNTEFWTALLLLATQSDTRDAAPTPFAFHVPACGPHHDHHRNAAGVDTGATLEFPAAKTWDDAARMQRDAFSKLRGEDLVTGRFIRRVPRTTIADVRQIAAYWSNNLAKVGEHSFADISYKHVLKRWKDAVAAVNRIPPNADPTAVYEHNTDFWEAVITIAIQIAVTAEAPTRWTLVKEATKQAIADLPQTLVDLPSTLKTRVQNFASNVVARPLLYLGAGLGGLALAAYFLRRSNRGESHA